MARYGYVGMDDRSVYKKSRIEDELIVNGNALSEQLKGYRQVSVSGRGLIPFEVTSVSYLNRSGARPVSRKVGTREFVIKYHIGASSSKELREKYDTLMGELTGELDISFEDDPGHFYHGVILTGADTTEETSNSIVSTFTLTAFDPNRYTVETFTGGTVNINTEFVYAEEVNIAFTGTVTRPTIMLRSLSNGFTTDFRLTGTYNAGDKVKIRIGNMNGEVIVEGGTVELGTLARELVLFNGTSGRIEESPTSGNVTFKWRESKI